MKFLVKLYSVLIMALCLSSCANGDTNAVKTTTKTGSVTTERVFEIITADKDNVSTTTTTTADEISASDTSKTTTSVKKSTTTALYCYGK